MDLPHITKTEDCIIRLKLQGFSRKEIANQTFRSTGTIQRHFQNVYAKLHVQNEIELYNWYLKNVYQIEILKIHKGIPHLALILFFENEQTPDYSPTAGEDEDPYPNCQDPYYSTLQYLN